MLLFFRRVASSSQQSGKKATNVDFGQSDTGLVTREC